jgi:hypothetical protein
MKQIQAKARAPIDCSFEQLCRITSDTMSTKSHWICVDGSTVTICEQRNGEPAKASVSMPRAVFKRFVKWALQPQKAVQL